MSSYPSSPKLIPVQVPVKSPRIPLPDTILPGPVVKGRSRIALLAGRITSNKFRIVPAILTGRAKLDTAIRDHVTTADFQGINNPCPSCHHIGGSFNLVCSANFERFIKMSTSVCSKWRWLGYRCGDGGTVLFSYIAFFNGSSSRSADVLVAVFSYCFFQPFFFAQCLWRHLMGYKTTIVFPNDWF